MFLYTFKSTLHEAYSLLNVLSTLASLFYIDVLSINVLIIRGKETLQLNTQMAPPKACPRYYSHSYMITITNIYHFNSFSNNVKLHSRLSKHYKMINVPNERDECTN